jgi:hypothetical protein
VTQSRTCTQSLTPAPKVVKNHDYINNQYQ